MRTKRETLGQLILCTGCCCGRVDRGLPEVPVERIKAIWRVEHLNRTVQLTISGCLGPCDVPNVVLVLTGERMEWLGGIEGQAYDELIQWARACDASGVLSPLPESLAGNRLERFAAEEVVA